MYDISLLIGGIHDQPPHYDNPRLYACKRHGRQKVFDENDSKNYSVMHEVSRHLFNEDIMGQWSPASTVLDVTSKGDGIKLGVLNQLVNDSDGTTTTIKCGKPDETFKVERGEFTSIIDVQGAGVTFAGDFPHLFGVRNVTKDDIILNKIMTDLFKNLPDEITDENQIECFDILKNTKRLNDVCRLFFKVKPIPTKHEIYNLDGVGFIENYVIESGTYDYPT